MDYKIFIFSRKDLKIIVISTMIGGIAQILCSRYLKNHPELVNNDDSEKLKPIKPIKPGLRRFIPVPHGGALFELVGAKIVINAVIPMVFIAKNGAWLTAVVTTGLIVGKKIPTTAISTVLRHALPVNHSNLEKGYVLINGKKLEQCDATFEYMVQVLLDKDIPIADKKELSFKIIMQYVDLKTPHGRKTFLCCILAIFHVFSLTDGIQNHFILLQNLINAVKSGKLSKQLARVIIRRLIKSKMYVDPELAMVADYPMD